MSMHMAAHGQGELKIGSVWALSTLLLYSTLFSFLLPFSKPSFDDGFTSKPQVTTWYY